MTWRVCSACRRRRGALRRLLRRHAIRAGSRDGPAWSSAPTDEELHDVLDPVHVYSVRDGLDITGLVLHVRQARVVPRLVLIA